jgi:hypothetical protein
MAVSFGTSPTAYASHTLNGAVKTLNFSGVCQVESVTLDEKRLLLTAGFTSSAINDLLIGDDGQINPTGHVIDSLETRFQGARETQVLMHEGRVFVFVAGRDDNLGDAVHDQPVLEVDAILRGCQPYVVATKQPDQRRGFEIASQEKTLGAA